MNVGWFVRGELTAFSDCSWHYVITEERARVWVEVWIEGKGWLTVDPSRFAVNYEESFARKRTAADLRLRLFLDSLSYYWNRLVINYDFESQFIAASKTGAELKGLKAIRLDSRKIIKAVAWLLLLTGGVLLLTTKRISAEERLLKRFKRIVLEKYGIEIPLTSGLHEAVQSLDNPAVKEFVAMYTGVLYRDRKLTKEESQLLVQLLKEMNRGGGS